METGHNLKISVDLEQMNKKEHNKAYWTSKCEEIVRGVCALLNSFGGKLCINIENQDVVDFENILDNVIRAIEQRLKNFMSLWCLNNLVKMPKIQNKQYVYEISNSDKVFTIKYNLYLPTTKQVEEIPPCDQKSIEKILKLDTFFSSKVVKDLPRVNEYIFDKSISLTESNSLQFKHLLNKKSTSTTIANRIVNKSNKLTITLSAFSNQCGGHVLYGITNEGIVKGQVLQGKDKIEIEAKVTKEINKMIWQKTIERGKHWDIEFIPVKDDNSNEKASLFIIKISIKALPGGVFVQQPESYHIAGINNTVKLMSFEEWCSRMIFGVRPVPKHLSRIQWSSAKSQRKYFKIIFQLNELQNDAKYVEFKDLAKLFKKQNAGTATELFVMIVESVVAYKRGMMKTAESIIDKIEDKLKSCPNIDDNKFIEFRLLYAKSAIARAKRDYTSSYKYAQEGQKLAELIEPGVLTAWFFNHVAIVEKFLSVQRQGEENVKMEKSALNHYCKALQYAKASSIEQEFTRMIADLEQRSHIFRAITILGDFATGTNLPDVTPSKIKAAEEDLVAYKALVLEGFLPSNYRRTYYIFAKCDLRFAQWCQQQRNEENQQGGQQHQQQERQIYKAPQLLKDAYKKALKARELSNQYDFKELTTYANSRLGKITVMMVILNLSKCRKN